MTFTASRFAGLASILMAALPLAALALAGFGGGAFFG
jgi:hypothetical protein